MAANAKVAKVLEDHSDYTVKRGDKAVTYVCKCGAKDTPDGELWGRSWLINHQTSEIVKAL